jgi:N-acetylglutamate synthase-like GNAT family acetyltransferase
MIRLATRSDLVPIADLVCEFLQETSYSAHIDEIDIEHIRRLVFACLHGGYIWLYTVDEEIVGLLAAVREPNMWMPHKLSLRELIWYVKPQYRKSPSAGKLFVRFCKEADELLNNSKIDGYFTTRMSATDDYDLESRGFRLTEKLYLKD